MAPLPGRGTDDDEAEEESDVKTVSLEEFLGELHLEDLTAKGGAAVADLESESETSESGAGTPRLPPPTPSLLEQDTDLEEAEEVDPRVGETLDELNTAMTDVNALEGALAQARRHLKRVTAEGQKRCQEVAQKLKRSVRDAVPYYHKRAVAQMCQNRAQQALLDFGQAHDDHSSAKAALRECEQRVQAGGASGDMSLFERMSDAASAVIEAENRKRRAEARHGLHARAAKQALQDANAIAAKRKSSVERAAPYFAAKSAAEGIIDTAKREVQDVQAGLQDAKARYTAALAMLDKISNEVHERREAAKAARASNERPEAEAASSEPTGVGDDEAVRAEGDVGDGELEALRAELEELRDEVAVMEARESPFKAVGAAAGDGVEQ